MSTPPPVTSRPHLTNAEHAWAFVAGGGLTLIILSFGFAAMRTNPSNTLYLGLVGGFLLLIVGTAGWLIQLQPWKNFDDLTTPYYTGHAHHDEHAHDEHTDPEVHAAIAQISDANLTVGEPYMYDFEAGHIEPAEVAPIVAAEADLPPPPVILDPMSAFPEPTPEPVAAPAKPEPKPTKAAADDLTQLKGIGPKINGVLKAAGITTFAQLAEQDVAHLEQLVRAGDVKSVIHPENWIADSKKVVAGDRSVLEHQDTKT